MKRKNRHKARRRPIKPLSKAEFAKYQERALVDGARFLMAQQLGTLLLDAFMPRKPA